MISHKLGDLLDEFPPIRQVSTKTWVRLAVIALAEVTSQDRMSIPVAVRRMKLSGLLTKDGPYLGLSWYIRIPRVLVRDLYFLPFIDS